MALAKRPGGLYVANGRSVNADGVVLTDAPPVEPDTVPATAGTAAPVVNIADQIADGVARALALATAPAPVAPDPENPPAGKGK